MAKGILTFGDIEIAKIKFYHCKSPVPVRDADIENVFVSNKIYFVEKNL